MQAAALVMAAFMTLDANGRHIAYGGRKVDAHTYFNAPCNQGRTEGRQT